MHTQLARDKGDTIYTKTKSQIIYILTSLYNYLSKGMRKYSAHNNCKTKQNKTKQDINTTSCSTLCGEEKTKKIVQTF